MSKFPSFSEVILDISHLKLIKSAKTLLPNKVTFIGPGGLGLQHTFFEGGTVSLITKTQCRIEIQRPGLCQTCLNLSYVTTLYLVLF